MQNSHNSGFITLIVNGLIFFFKNSRTSVYRRTSTLKWTYSKECLIHRLMTTTSHFHLSWIRQWQVLAFSGKGLRSTYQLPMGARLTILRWELLSLNLSSWTFSLVIVALAAASLLPLIRDYQTLILYSHKPTLLAIMSVAWKMAAWICWTTLILQATALLHPSNCMFFAMFPLLKPKL